jgi:predicted TIM-barrel fold metal-dependent hydrolase
MDFSRAVLHTVLASVVVWTELAGAQAQAPSHPIADHHVHLQSRATWDLFHETLPVVTLPPVVDRVLRDFEAGWGSADKSNIAALFTNDGVLQWADDWARGPRAIRIALLGKGGGLRMRPQAFEAHDSLGFIAGAYGFYRDTTWVDQGRFSLTLRRRDRDPWHIAVAFLSNTTPPTPPVGDALTATSFIAQMDSVGLQRAAVMSLAYQYGAPYRIPDANAQARARAENDWVARQIAPYAGRLVGFCSVHLLADSALAELSRCITLPRMIGIKLHFTNSDVDLRNSRHVERLRAIFRLANARRVPIAAHIRTLEATYGRRDAEVFLREVLAEAPDVTVQIAHLAGWGGYGDETDAALAVFAEAIASGDRRTANLYFDLSQVVSRDLPFAVKQRIVDRTRQIGVQRMLFAVDGAEPPLAVWANIRSLPLSDTELRVIATNLAPYLR